MGGAADVDELLIDQVCAVVGQLRVLGREQAQEVDVIKRSGIAAAEAAEQGDSEYRRVVKALRQV